MKLNYWMRFLVGIVLILAYSTISWAADNITVLDGNRTARTIGTDEVGGVHYYKNVTVNPDGTAVTWDDNTGLGVISHEHSGHGIIHMHLTSVVADKRVVLIDLSDTTNWPHTTGESIHLEHIDFQIDSDPNGSYIVYFQYLNNCGTSDCDSHTFWHLSGSKTTGNNAEVQINWTANGPVLKSGTGGVLGETTLNDTNWQTDIGFPSPYIPGSDSTNPGDGDLVMYIDWIAGSITVSTTIAYHTHDAAHP